MIVARHQRTTRIDILVNHAGLRVRKAFGEFSHEDFNRLVTVDLRAPFFCEPGGGAHHARAGRRSGDPHGQPARYRRLALRRGNLAKAGLIQLTRLMALELFAKNIYVNAACPSPVSTKGFFSGRNPGELEQRTRRPDRAIRDRRGGHRNGGFPGLERRGPRGKTRTGDRRRLGRSLNSCGRLDKHSKRITCAKDALNENVEHRYRRRSRSLA